MQSDVTVIFWLLAGALVGAFLFWIVQQSVSGRDDRPDAELTPVPLPVATGRTADALILLDVDRLAEMNATYGPDIGDRALERITDVIRRATPPGAAHERLDGGRFVIWLSNADIDAAVTLAETLRTLCPKATVECGGRRVGRTISAGVVPLSGAEGRARALMAAQAALQRAKAQGGDRVAQARAPQQPNGPTAADVQEAIRSGAIGYYVQPVFDLATGKATGVEALLRWIQPDGSVMPPSDFLHRIDELPEDAAQLFADLAVTAARPFVESGQPLGFGLNVTAGALDEADSQSRDWLFSLLDRLPAERIVLELLESAVITDPSTAKRTVDNLRSRGCKIALDDFGTGLSNMDRILEYEPDYVKLDRTLVTNLGVSGRPEAVIGSIVEIARSLDITLVAEGLETAADAEIVSRLGVHLGQGYYLGRPQPAAYWAEKLI